MPEAEWRSEDRAPSRTATGASMPEASGEEEEGFSTVIFCVDMSVSQLSSFQLKPQLQ